MIAEVNLNHEKLLNFRPAKFENLDGNKYQDNEKRQEIFEPPIITELYLVTAQVSMKKV